MAFSGIPVVLEVSDGLVRIAGVSIDGGQTGTIMLHGGKIPGTPLVLEPDIELPAAFKPRPYSYPPSVVPLRASVQVSTVLNFTPQDAFVFLGTSKSGTDPADFLITIANMSGSASSFLGAARPYACVASGSVTNTSGGTTVNGDVAAATGTITGFPPGTINGTGHEADADALVALHDAAVAFNALGAIEPTAVLDGDLSGLSLLPGIYRIAGDATLDGTLTLDANGEFNAFWVFQIAGDFDMANNAVMSAINSAEANTMFWIIDGAASFGTTCQALGTFIATADVVHQSATVLPGRTIALAGDVTLTDCVVTTPSLPSGFFPANSGPLEIYVRFH